MCHQFCHTQTEIPDRKLSGLIFVETELAFGLGLSAFANCYST